MANTLIRPFGEGDAAALDSLYKSAFPDEDLVPLVRALLEIPGETHMLVAERERRICGHVAFTNCKSTSNEDALALLGPLAVLPTCQGAGLGSRLVVAGLEAMQARDVKTVVVLGDPGYYSRFGFRPERNLVPPFPLPAEWGEAWQSVAPTGGADPAPGKLIVPEPWAKPELWH